MDSLMQNLADTQSATQKNIDAITKSSQIWLEGWQAFSQGLTAMLQARYDRNLATWKALTAVKSLQEAMAVQANFLRLSLDNGLTETGKLAKESMQLAERTIAPMKAGMSSAVEGSSQSPG